MNTEVSMKVIDLFCGLGGLTVGAIQAADELGLTCELAFACDMDAAVSKFYNENFSSRIGDYYQGDISQMVDDDFHGMSSRFEKLISSKYWGVDFLFAGPPCQGHSNLNNHSRRSDPRNALYLKTIKFIKLSMPKYFLIENVPSVIHSKESVVERSKDLLRSYGYEVDELVIDFIRLGVPQSRKRHVIVGSLAGDLCNVIDGVYTDEAAILSDVLHDLIDIDRSDIFNSPSKMSATNTVRADYLYSTDSYDLPNELRPPCHQGQHSYKSMYGRLRWDDVAQTITGGFGSMGQGRFLHPLQKRVITPHEAARIQGLPDWLDFSGVTKRSELQKMIGNAVPPALSRRFILSTQGR
ncbi:MULTISPECIES: DNA cytosine methyltransferase [unclassified Pseudomonas]|uniref:DNA cytosine methyltransferase n=1 Tax=unclassified Pseudomonas TaxID=196821 RepID=UPI000FDD19BD|nr:MULTISPECIES: DNA cytosine methyltransferase [unclassified Pseudomonas]WNZ82149.1 DNA cytosine methyltransferase [Pseudomonas sp. P108]